MSNPRFTYLGHSTVRVDLPTREVILIDPWVTNNPSCPDEQRVSLNRLDAMLITQGHADHMQDAVELAKKFQPKFVVANFEIGEWLRRKGVKNVSAMNIGGSQDVLGARVSMTRADHSCGITDGDSIIYGGAAAGYVVRLPSGFSFYYAGDTGLFSDMKLIAEIYQPKLAFLPIGGRYTMDPHQAARACEFLQVPQVVPVHWGTFPVLTGTPEQFQSELRKRNVSAEMIALQPGETYS